MNCEVCGKERHTSRGAFDYTSLARLDRERHRVVLEDVEVIRCGCGESARIPNVDGLHHLIGIGLVRDAAPLDGSAVRFLRKTIGRTQEEFAKAIDITPQYLSDWERGREIPKKATRIAAAVQFLNFLLHSEDASISLSVVSDALDRMMARTRTDLPRSKLAFEVDTASCPPAWMIAEIEGNGRSRQVGGGR